MSHLEIMVEGLLAVYVRELSWNSHLFALKYLFLREKENIFCDGL
jgi:hypothetical protein